MPTQDDAALSAAVEAGGTQLLTDRVYSELRDLILHGALVPGQQLSIPALAGRLEVSRSPVREAVQRLIYEGIATQVPYAGARVALIDDDAIAEILLAREPLDGLAAGLAATLIDAEALARLHDVLTRHEAALGERAAISRAAELDMAFHRIIVDSSGNSTLIGILGRLDTLSHMARPDLWNPVAYQRIVVGEHAGIFAAIEAGDAVEAERTARAHIASLRTRIQRTARDT